MNPEPSVALADPAQRSAGQSNLNTLLDSASAARLAMSVQPAGETHVTVVDASPLPPPAPVPHKTRRRGRVACLPKTARDMVGRMLTNGVPYKISLLP